MRKGLLVLMAMLLVVSWSFATELPGITPIKDIQYVADPATDDASPLLGDTVTVEGWVTWEPQSKGGDSFWIADSAGAWHGINVYSSAGDDWNFAFGTHIRVRGKIGAYQGLTEIMPMDPVADITVLADTVDWANPPEAIAYTVIDPALFADGAASMEQYESVLVQFNNVYCSNEDAGFGEWEISDGTNTVLIDNPQTSLYGYQHKWVLNQPYEYVRGVINSHYGYKLLPEIARDLKVAEDTANDWYTQLAYFQQVRYSDMTIRDGVAAQYTTDFSYESADYWEFFVPDTTFIEDTLTVKGVVTMETGLSYAGDLGAKFIISDANYYGETPYEEQPWSSVLSYTPDASEFPTLLSGDIVEVTGYISEYITDQGNMTELFITKPITIIGAADSLPAPAQVTVAEVRDPAQIEPWGTCFVYLTGLQVVNNAPGLSNMKFVVDDPIADSTPGFGIDDDSDFATSPEVDNWDTFGQPPVNTVIDSVVGWVYHHFGGYEGTDGTTWAYKVAPRYPLTEIVLGEAPPNVLAVGRDATVGSTSADMNVGAKITDNVLVDSAYVQYKVGLDGTWMDVKMASAGTDSFAAAIPAQSEGDFVFYLIKAWDDGERTSVYPDTNTVNPYGYMVTDGDLSYYDIQVNPLGGGASLYEGYEVTLTGVLLDSFVVGDAYGSYDLSAPIYWMQGGDSAQYNAIAVDIPTDLMPVGEYFEVGDEVTVTGTVWENDPGLSGTNAWQWGDLTRISDVTAATLVSSGNTPVAYEVTADELVGNAEAYESQLVKVLDPTMTVANSYDWTFNDGNGDFLVDDDVIAYTSDVLVQDWFDNLDVGTNPDWLSGIWLYSYSTFKLELRGYYDVAGLTPNSVEDGLLPLTYELSPVYPNPFNPSATVAFQLPENAKVQVMVYNMLGQRVSTLVDRPMQAGKHRVTFNGSNLASGVYFVRMDANNFSQMRKMVMVK